MEESRNPSLLQNEKRENKKKITITVDEDDPCIKKEVKEEITEYNAFPSYDPRFQQQNQTQRCYVMYTDFYRCEHILGKDTEACQWFKNVFKSICPNAWIERWDELRLTNRFAWHKYKTQGDFPGHKYGD